MRGKCSFTCFDVGGVLTSLGAHVLISRPTRSLVASCCSLPFRCRQERRRIWTRIPMGRNCLLGWRFWACRCEKKA